MIVLIDNYDSFTYNLYQQVAYFYPEIKVICNDQTTLEELEQLNPKAILISPGPGTPKDSGISVEVIQKLGPKIPILGVCLGMQAMAFSEGGKIIRAPKCVHGKAGAIFHKRQGLFKGMKLPFLAARYHSLIVEKESLPKNLSVEAFSEEDLIMALKHTHYPIWGVQFHPESILSEEGDLIIKNFLKLAKVI